MVLKIGDFLTEKYNKRVYEVTHINQYDFDLFSYSLRNVYPGDAEVFKVTSHSVKDYFELTPNAKVLYGNKIQSR